MTTKIEIVRTPVSGHEAKTNAILSNLNNVKIINVNTLPIVSIAGSTIMITVITYET